jgi:hypothetical protein
VDTPNHTLSKRAVAISDGSNAFSGMVSSTIFAGIAANYALQLASRLGKKQAS